MAFTATMHHVFRPGGNANNGGGYDPALTGGVDYSNQDAAQETYSGTLTAAGAQATVVLGSGTFSANIKGNVVYVASGTNVTVGRYLVLSRDSDTQITLDRNWCSGAVTAGVGYMGGSMLASVATDAWWDALIDGSKVYFQAGTHALPNSISTTSGTAAAPITVEGFTTTLGDRPRTSRPVLDTNTSGMAVQDFWIFRNLEIENNSVSATYCFQIGEHNVLEDVKVHAKNAGDGLIASSSNGANKFVRCEFISTNGDGFESGNPNHCFIGCIFDGGTGSYGANLSVAPTGGNFCNFTACIFKNGGTGGVFIASTSTNYSFERCLFYNNTTYGLRIAGSTFAELIVLNCAFIGNGTGISFNATQEANFIDYNLYFGNTTNLSNVTQGAHDIIADMIMTDPGNDDFSIPVTSPAFKTAAYLLNNLEIFGDKPGSMNIGPYQDTWNIGAWQKMRADLPIIREKALIIKCGFEEWDQAMNHNNAMIHKRGFPIACGMYGSEYANLAALPDATTMGGVPLSTLDGKLYFSTGTAWEEVDFE